MNTGSNGFTVSEYNLMGQVTRVNTDEAEVQYSYNVSGLRKSKTVNSETTNFIWNGQNMIAETEENDAIQNTYTYDMTGVILRNDSDWYLKNAHGDVVGMVDSNNNLIQEYRYEHAIIGTSDENLVKSRVSELVPFLFCQRASTIHL